MLFVWVPLDGPAELERETAAAKSSRERAWGGESWRRYRILTLCLGGAHREATKGCEEGAAEDQRGAPGGLPDPRSPGRKEPPVPQHLCQVRLSSGGQAAGTLSFPRGPWRRWGLGSHQEGKAPRPQPEELASVPRVTPD